MMVHTFNEGTLTDIYYIDRELVQLSKNKTAADLVPPKFDVEVQCCPKMKDKEVDTVEFLAQNPSNSHDAAARVSSPLPTSAGAGDQRGPSPGKGKAGSEERKGGSKLGKLKNKVK